MANKAQPKKIKIDEMLTDLSPHELEGTLAAVQGQLNHLIETYGPNARLCWNGDYWPQYSDSPSPRYELKINREETDREQAIRLEKEEEARTLREKRDRQEFERLKKQFGDK